MIIMYTIIMNPKNKYYFKIIYFYFYRIFRSFILYYIITVLIVYFIKYILPNLILRSSKDNIYLYLKLIYIKNKNIRKNIINISRMPT